LLERRSNEGGVKYKIIDIDGSEISLTDLLDRYYFSENHHTSYSVIETKFHNNTIKHYSIIVDEQVKGNSYSDEDLTDKKDNANYDSDSNAFIDKSHLYECYYCDEFVPTDNRDIYEKNVILSHDGKLAYPSLTYLEKRNLKPPRKKWKVYINRFNRFYRSSRITDVLKKLLRCLYFKY